MPWVDSINPELIRTGCYKSTRSEPSANTSKIEHHTLAPEPSPSSPPTVHPAAQSLPPQPCQQTETTDRPQRNRQPNVLLISWRTRPPYPATRWCAYSSVWRRSWMKKFLDMSAYSQSVKRLLMGREINSINSNSLFQSLAILWRTPAHLQGGGEDDINKILWFILYLHFNKFLHVRLYCIGDKSRQSKIVTLWIYKK